MCESFGTHSEYVAYEGYIQRLNDYGWVLSYERRNENTISQ